MISNIQQDLKKLARSDKANTLQRFFKTGPGQYGEGDKFIGVMVPDIRKVSQKYKDLALKEVLKLLHSPFHEERLCALLILVEQYKKGDNKKQKQIFDLYLKNYKYINNWDLIDLTAPRIVGAYLIDKPKDILYKLAKSKNLWQRRVSILATFQFIYYGQSKETIKIAKILLHDDHDLIQKAVGWMLREVGKRCDEQILLDFLNKHYKVMPRTMLRYAIERLPESKRQRYLGKNKINFGLAIIFLLGSLSLPNFSQAMGELMISPREYNVDHTVQSGEIWTIKNILLVNLGQRDLEVFFRVSADASQENILGLDKEKVMVELGKAKNIDLSVTTPLSMKAGYYKERLILSTLDDPVTKIEGTDSIINLNFVVAESNYFESIGQRLKSEYREKDLTFYLFSSLLILWLVFSLYIGSKKIRKKYR